MGSVRREDGQKEVQQSLLRRKVAFRSETNNHPGRGNGRCKGLDAEMMCFLLSLKKTKMSWVGVSEWGSLCPSVIRKKSKNLKINSKFFVNSELLMGKNEPMTFLAETSLEIEHLSWRRIIKGPQRNY